MSESIKVTITDPESGEVLGEKVLDNEYLLVTAGNRCPCERDARADDQGGCMSIDADELARLKSAANAATPGPWEDDDIYAMVCPTQIDGCAFPADRAIAQAHIEADRRHMAKSDPPTVLVLLAEVERLRRRLGENEPTDTQIMEAFGDAG